MISEKVKWGLLAVLFLVACTPATSSPTPTTILTPIPETGIPEGLYPPDTRTGIPEIDLVLEAVANEDFDVPKNLVVLTEVPCTPHPEYPRRPLCPEGVEFTTPIAMFPNWGCEKVNILSLEEVKQYFDTIHEQHWPLYVYAVYQQPGHFIGGRNDPYVIRLATSLEDRSGITIFLDKEGDIFRTDTACGPLTKGTRAVKFEDFQFILLPDKDFVQWELPSTGSMSASDLQNFLKGEAVRMLAWLQIATGSSAACEYPCIGYRYLQNNVQALLGYCRKLEPTSFRQSPNYDIQMHGETVEALERACETLISARTNLGEPQWQNEGWQMAVREARAALAFVGTPYGLYPLDTRTGISEVDVVLEALATKDVDTLQSLVSLAEVPCTTQQYDIRSGPLCPEGVEDGTPIAVFLDQCSLDYYIYSFEFAPPSFDFYGQSFPQFVYAVYSPLPFGEQDSPVAYEIVRAPNLEDVYGSISISIISLDIEGRIIGNTGCDYFLPEDRNFILPPLMGPTSSIILENYIDREFGALHFRLSAALGDILPSCDFSCVDEVAFSSIVEDLLQHCQDFNPESFRQLPGFDHTRFSERVPAMAQACKVLLSAQSTLGTPQKNYEWGRVLVEARAALYDELLPNAEVIEGNLTDEARLILDWLRIILEEEDVPAGSAWFKETFEENVLGLIEYCQINVKPEHWRLLPEFDSQKHGPILEASAQACGILVSAQESLGEPQENGEWMAVVLEAKDVLVNANIPEE